MRRFVSVWLADFAIARLRRMWCRQVPLQGLSAPLSRPLLNAPGPHDDPVSKPRQPLALTETGPRGVILATINQAARRVGLQPGLSVSDAKAIYPGLLTVPMDRSGTAAALRDLALWLGRYGPNRNTDGIDGLWVEVTGVAHLFGGETALVEDLRRRMAQVGLTPRIGMADTYGAAHALARYGCSRDRPSAVVPSGETAHALAALPVDGLRLTDESLLLLKRLGLRRIGQVAAIPRSAMAARFCDDAKGARRQDREALARAVVWRLDQLSGEIAEPRPPLEPAPARSRRLLFAEPLISSDGIATALAQAAAGLSEDLAEIGEGAIRARLSLFRADGTVASLDAGVSRPSRDPTHLLKLFDVKLPEIDAGLGIDVMVLATLQVGPLTAVQAHLRNGDGAPKDPGATAELVDRLSNRLGRERVSLLGTAASHWPERAVVARPAQDVLQQRTQSARVAASPETAQWIASGPDAAGDEAAMAARRRPQFLLERPEPIEVLAALPEGPPARFKWRRRQCRVRLASPPERITPEWWRELCAPDRNADVAIAPREPREDSRAAIPKRTIRPRDYYILEDSTGSRFWVFREGLYHRTEEGDGRPPQWFMHGVFA